MLLTEMRTLGKQWRSRGRRRGDGDFSFKDSLHSRVFTQRGDERGACHTPWPPLLLFLLLLLLIYTSAPLQHALGAGGLM